MVSFATEVWSVVRRRFWRGLLIVYGVSIPAALILTFTNVNREWVMNTCFVLGGISVVFLDSKKGAT